MGNACASDENKATQGPANQEVNDNTEQHPGLRQPQRNEFQESTPPRVEQEKENQDQALKNSSTLSGQLYDKNLPPINELPEITNQNVRMTLSKVGDYDHISSMNQSQAMQQSNMTVNLFVEVSKKFENSDFKGIFEFPDHETYKMFLQTENFVFETGPSAEGTQIWNDGSIYEGSYRYGQFHGQGRMIHKNGDCYEGEFEFGLAKNLGKFTKLNGEMYQGYWEDNLPNGEGRLINPENGEEYEGQFKNGKKHGQGLMAHERYNYMGEWANGKMNGTGIYTWTDGTNRKYEGGFVEGHYHGQGTYTFQNGDVYIGEYKNGKRDGFGSLKMVNKGLVFEGYWVNGKKQGPGKIEENGKMVIEGNWQDDEFVHNG